MTVMLGQRYKQIIMIIFNEGTQLAMTGFSVALKISHKCVSLISLHSDLQTNNNYGNICGMHLEKIIVVVHINSNTRNIILSSMIPYRCIL